MASQVFIIINKITIIRILSYPSPMKNTKKRNQKVKKGQIGIQDTDLQTINIKNQTKILKIENKITFKANKRLLIRNKIVMRKRIFSRETQVKNKRDRLKR